MEINDTYSIIKRNTMLKYLFIVEYKDGSIYKQNQDDISLTDNKRSCFYDVKQDEVSRFIITDCDGSFIVDLSDGHFEVNGIPFFMHDSGLGLKDFRLIFYRQHEHKVNVGSDGSRKQLSHEITYCIGWQTNDENGMNIKRIMEVK